MPTEAHLRQSSSQVPKGQPSSMMSPDVWVHQYLEAVTSSPAQRQGSVEDVMRLISSGRYRRTALDPESARDARAKTASKVERSEPIEFSVPFGCYKGAFSPCAPFPDWSEFFNLLYLAEYAKSIVAAHPPGVRVVYTYSSIGVTEANKLSPDAQSRYVARFLRLLQFVNLAVHPANIRFQLLDVASLYAPGEVAAELASHQTAVRAEWHTLSDETRGAKLARAARNLAVREPSTRTIEESAIAIEAVDRLSRRRWFNKYSDRIQIVFVRGPQPSIHLGTCRSSQCQPLAGVGVLEEHRGTWMPRIISIRRWAETSDNYVPTRLTLGQEWMPPLPVQRS